MPTIYRVLPGAAIYFSMLDTVSHVVKLTQNKHSIEHYKHTNAENFTIGFLARTIASTIMCPITVLKTRFELSTNTNVNMLKSLSGIYRNEGIRGLFSGLLPTLGRDAPYAGISYLCFRQLQGILSTFNQHSSIDFGSLIDPISGGASGVLGTMITYPFDVVRTRLQLQVRTVGVGGSVGYVAPAPGVISVFKTMIQSEGYSSLFRGAVPRLCKRSVASAISWSIYEFSVGGSEKKKRVSNNNS